MGTGERMRMWRGEEESSEKRETRRERSGGNYSHDS